MRNAHAFALGALASVLCAALGFGSAGAQQVWYAGAFEYAGGTYGLSERFESTQLTTTLGFTASSAGLAIGVPFYLAADGGLVSVGGRGPGGGVIPTSDSLRQKLRGSRGRMGGSALVAESAPFAMGASEPSDDGGSTFGDPLISGWARVASGSALFQELAVTGALKPAVVDAADGVGTGEWDWSLGTSATFAARQTLILAELGYTWLGDDPAEPFRDGLYGSFGVARGLGDNWIASVSVGASRAGLPELPTAAWMGVLISSRLGDRTGLSAGASIGLSEASAGLSVFAAWRFRILGRG